MHACVWYKFNIEQTQLTQKRNKFYLILLMFVSYLTKQMNGTEH